ncbi:hypothetical protein SRABI128_05104 [Microbacterium sp. Bi128]|nr:hypothetical protein SRABI128_05104 [Microbacterium sp. Bi128]
MSAASNKRPPDIAASVVCVDMRSMLAPRALSVPVISRTIPGRSLPRTVSDTDRATAPRTGAGPCTDTVSVPVRASSAERRSSARSGDTDTSMIPAKAPASSASSLVSQLPPWTSTMSATAATSPARSSPTTVITRVVMPASVATDPLIA